MNIQISVACLNTNNEQAERKIFFKSHLKLQKKKNKIPKNNLNKEVKTCTQKNYKTQMKESEGATKKNGKIY